MPVPTPRSGENQDAFISRCARELSKEDPERPNKQVVAICYSQWRKREDMHQNFEIILRNFVRHWGDKLGLTKFGEWLARLGLDSSKAYNNQVQLNECINGMCEAFRWTAPLISIYREDKDAKYYKVLALTANVSMNKNDYRDAAELAKAAPTMTYRPLNLNHDHSKWLPFPEARVDWAMFEDNAVEAIIRIPNSGVIENTGYSMKDIQRMIEGGDIMHPSIEGEPRSGAVTEEGRAPLWYNFTAMALLEKDVTLPGDPVTWFDPIPLNESMGRSLVESLSLGVNQGKKGKTMTEENKLDEGSSPYIINSCGQCKFFAEHLPTITRTDKVMATEPSDGYVLTAESGIGPGIGECLVAKQLVRKNDSACYDGRPRDTPTSADDDERIKENIEELVMKGQIEDLENKLLKKTQSYNDEITSHATTRGLLVDIESKNAQLTKELAVAVMKSGRLEKDSDSTQSLFEAEKQTNADLQVRHDKLLSDTTFFKEDVDRKEAVINGQRKQIAELKEAVAGNKRLANDESAKRATFAQRAQDAEDRQSAVLKENTIMAENLTKARQDAYDESRGRSELAKGRLEDQRIIQELREKNKGLIEAIRDLKQKLSKRPRKIILK